MKGPGARDEKDQKLDVLRALDGVYLPPSRIQGITGIPYTKVNEILRWAKFREFVAEFSKEEIRRLEKEGRTIYDPVRRNPTKVHTLTKKGSDFVHVAEEIFGLLRMPETLIETRNSLP